MFIQHESDQGKAVLYSIRKCDGRQDITLEFWEKMSILKDVYKKEPSSLASVCIWHTSCSSDTGVCLYTSFCTNKVIRL